MRPSPIFLAAMLSFTHHAFARNGDVIRLGDGQPLPGVRLETRTGEVLGQTDWSGFFRINESVLNTGISSPKSSRLTGQWLTRAGSAQLQLPAVAMTLELRDLQGKQIWKSAWKGQSSGALDIPKLGHNGIQVLHWKQGKQRGAVQVSAWANAPLHFGNATSTPAASRSVILIDTLVATLNGYDTLRIALKDDSTQYLSLRMSPNYPARNQRFLKAVGNEIRNAQNRKVHLHGINLGGWLVTENWMCGMTDTLDKTHRKALLTLEERFGAARADSLLNVWRDNWITTKDLDRMKSNYLNLVRVPFSWRDFQRADGSWIRKANGEIDFSRLDWIVREAGNRGMYTLLDFHVWPSQLEVGYGHISDRDTVRERTAAIWTEIAKRFKGNPDVAGYNLMNEPTGSYNYSLPDSLYKAIRRVDPDHMISMEWVKPDPVRWTNVLYQDHHYVYGANLDSNMMAFDSLRKQIRMHDSLNVPFYVGETHMDGDSSWSWVLNQYSMLGVHWSPWTWKTVDMWGWGILSLQRAPFAVNLRTDSYETIRSRWSRLSDTTLATVRTGNETVLREISRGL